MTEPLSDAVSQMRAGSSDLAEFQRLLAAGRTQSASATATDLSNQVWYNRKGAYRQIEYTESGGARPRNLPMSGTVRGERIGTDLEAVLNLPYRWVNDKKKMDKLFSAVSAATGKPVTDFFSALSVWQDAVKASNQSWVGTNGGKNGTPLSPWEALNLMSRTPGGYGNSTSAPKTETHRSVSEVSDGAAWSFINDAVTRLLGRAASTSEVQEFASKANRIAADNPTVTTTTTDGKGNTTSKTKGGIEAGDLELAARNTANRDSEAGAYQAASTYYNALLGTLSSMANLPNPA